MTCEPMFEVGEEILFIDEDGEYTTGMIVDFEYLNSCKEFIFEIEDSNFQIYQRFECEIWPIKNS